VGRAKGLRQERNGCVQGTEDRLLTRVMRLKRWAGNIIKSLPRYIKKCGFHTEGDSWLKF
jgi:hypothetical protein